jgi:hypothetical protein
MRLLSLSLVVLLVIAICGCSYKVSSALQKETVTLEKAIEIGKKELEKRSSLLPEDNMRIAADDEKKAWREIKTVYPIVLQEKIKRLHRENKKYWVVSYIPKKPMLGGINIVFVDRTNGKILDFYGGE